METTGKKLDSKQTPETKQQNISTEIRLFDADNEEENASVGELIQRMEEQQQRNFQNQLKLINISDGKDLSLSDIKAAEEQDKTY